MLSTTELENADVEPTGDKLLVCPDELVSKTKGGIHIPNSARGRPTQGTVIAVGPGRYDHMGNHVPMPCKAGDMIIYGQYSGTEIKLDGKLMIILKEPDVMAIIRPKEGFKQVDADTAESMADQAAAPRLVVPR